MRDVFVLQTVADLTIVLVDDEVVNRNVAVRMLKRLGCACSTLTDGSEVEPAMAAAGTIPPATSFSANQSITDIDVCDGADWRCDALLLDIHMRTMNGDELCRRLRASGCSLPIIALTGDCTPDDCERFEAMGFNAVLGKPFNLQQLKEALETFCLGR